ncbi:DgyrCDS10451 [Dimorphilus gyrociliatus]|uniref:DgyrCDS10451 n=1 Tax=Dimorphilus gyrociliatus TaxID=2664684 RepID=A0A7I8W1D9_9ANNE|nr:DgyrCDS10451 [Dimorphilus gyrociliatus]
MPLKLLVFSVIIITFSLFYTISCDEKGVKFEFYGLKESEWLKRNKKFLKTLNKFLIDYCNKKSKACFVLDKYEIVEKKSGSLFITFFSRSRIDEKSLFKVVKDKREEIEDTIYGNRILQVGSETLPLPPRKELNIIIGTIFVFLTLILTGIGVGSFIYDQRKYRIISQKRRLSIKESEFRQSTSSQGVGIPGNYMKSVALEHSALPPIPNKRSLISHPTHTVSFSVSEPSTNGRKREEDRKNQIAVIRISDEGVYHVHPPTTISN